MAAPTSAKSMMVTGSEWTIQNMQRVCSTDDTLCTWNFAIFNGENDTTVCTFNVSATTDADVTGDASVTTGGPAECGVYTITTGWSGQFGEGNGFTTLAVVNNNADLIIYPAYTDKQLQAGIIVSPDQSYAPEDLP
ncbi:hypothetical protein N7495_008643 [Penicillium taxi]|uniref:uncharacterized protein n=1 Tax=Penicillium taxi TaxID=168475 RepID=UPI00254598D0|nr:uncharacterized protein N7495_008643 [Penicillium taxi]KAJ5888602.1 hypothetical protein N7495_008643 [Penicillium taxi]